MPPKSGSRGTSTRRRRPVDYDSRRAECETTKALRALRAHQIEHKIPDRAALGDFNAMRRRLHPTIKRELGKKALIILREEGKFPKKKN